MWERGIYPQDCPRTVRSRRNRCGNTELACSPNYHGEKTAYWAASRQSLPWDYVRVTRQNARDVGNISMDHRTLVHHSVPAASLERHDQSLSHEETSTQGRSLFRKAGSAKCSFLGGACHALRRRCRRGPQQTCRASGCAGERLRYTVGMVSAFCRTETEEATGLCRTSYRSFYLRGSALCKNRTGSRRTRSTVSRP